MMQISTMRLIRLLPVMLALSALGGCANFATSASSRLASNLSGAILNQDDPETVEAGMPAYLLLIDSLIEGDPQNENLLLAGSKLYGSYASAFIREPERAKRLARKARDYSDRALCAHGARLCNLLERPYNDFAANVSGKTIVSGYYVENGAVSLSFSDGSSWTVAGQ